MPRHAFLSKAIVESLKEARDEVTDKQREIALFKVCEALLESVPQFLLQMSIISGHILVTIL